MLGNSYTRHFKIAVFVFVMLVGFQNCNFQTVNPQQKKNASSNSIDDPTLQNGEGYAGITRSFIRFSQNETTCNNKFGAESIVEISSQSVIQTTSDCEDLAQPRVLLDHEYIHNENLDVFVMKEDGLLDSSDHLPLISINQVDPSTVVSEAYCTNIDIPQNSIGKVNVLIRSNGAFLTSHNDSLLYSNANFDIKELNGNESVIKNIPIITSIASLDRQYYLDTTSNTTPITHVYLKIDRNNQSLTTTGRLIYVLKDLSYETDMTCYINRWLEN